MRGSDRTEIGGGDGDFRSTHWTEIFRARTQDVGRQRATMDELLARYWKPVYCYLRRKGNDNETAKDLTQGFFHEVVLGRDLVQKADQSKGRFRSFLLTALDRYVRDQHRMKVAEKRMPEAGIIPLDKLGPANVPEPVKEAGPEDAFHYAWAFRLLDDVLGQLKTEYVGSGKEAHLEVFRARFIFPIIKHTEPTPFSDLCDRFGANEKEIYNMLGSVKRRFQKILRDQIRQPVGLGEDVDEKEVDREIDDLVKILAKSPA